MDSNLSDVDSIRRAAVSRRGGVRVRGGRLPPIRIRNVSITTSNKKVLSPNIPQRRIQVKREILDPVKEKHSYGESKEFENSRGRGRGRGSKVYLQTEGSFLGDGPALKVKKEPSVPYYDKSSYARSTRVKTEVQIKVDSNKINELLECYDEKEAFLDTDFKPVRLPFLKLEKNSKESKLEIKKDISSEDVKPFIKQEPISDDEWDAFTNKYPIPIKKEYDFDTKVPDQLKDFKLFQDDNTLILLQFPSCLPFEKACGSLNQEKSSSKEKNSENEVAAEGEFGVPVKDLTEGYIGKLQVMKSGCMRIIMGSTIISLEDGVNSKSMWEAASISTENKNEGDLIMLGKIGFKMVLRPRLKCMMEKAPAEKDICTRTKEY